MCCSEKSRGSHLPITGSLGRCIGRLCARKGRRDDEIGLFQNVDVLLQLFVHMLSAREINLTTQPLATHNLRTYTRTERIRPHNSPRRPARRQQHAQGKAQTDLSRPQTRQKCAHAHKNRTRIPVQRLRGPQAEKSTTSFPNTKRSERKRPVTFTLRVTINPLVGGVTAHV